MHVLLAWNSDFSIKQSDQFSFKLSAYEYSGKKFSQRETQCLHLLLRGKSAKETAKLLNISAKSVESHIEKIKCKMNVRTRSQLIEECILCGFDQVIPVEHLR